MRLFGTISCLVIIINLVFHLVVFYGPHFVASWVSKFFAAALMPCEPLAIKAGIFHDVNTSVISFTGRKINFIFKWYVPIHRQQPSPLLYSIDIWPARNSRLTQRETNHFITRCSSELAWSYLAGSSPGQLVIDLFAQHQRFAVFFQFLCIYLSI